MTDLNAAYHRLYRSARTTIVAASAIALSGPARADAPATSAPMLDFPLAGGAFTLPAALGEPEIDGFLPLADLIPAPPSKVQSQPSSQATAQPQESGAASPTAAQSVSQSPSQGAVRPQGRVEVLKFKTLRRNLQTGDLEASGGVQAVYTDPTSKKQTTMIAQNLTYDGTTGQVQASGGVRLEREEGTFSGDELSYNFQDQAGYVTNAILETDYVRMRGERITARGDGTYEIDHGSFTTCIRAHPDYLIRAHRLVYAPNQYVSARGVTFYAGKTKLITWPSYRRSLRAGSQSAPLPLPGYNSTDGIYVQYHDTPILERHNTLDYLARVGFRRFPTGAAAYETDIAPSSYNAPPPRTILPILANPLRGILEQLSPPTYAEYTENIFAEQYAPRSIFTAVLQNQQFVYNRRRTDLSVSRFPEIGVRLVNILGNRAQNPNETPATAPPPPEDRVVGNTEAPLRRVPNAPFLFNLDATIGELQENPTDATAGRIALRASLASQPYIIGKRISLRAGLSSWLNFYTTGTIYNITSPEVELDYIPTRTSRFGVGYRYLSASGRTPFVFDARDIRNELRLQYQVGGPWAFGVFSAIDIDRSRDYDTEFAVLRNFDCMQVGVSYRLHSHEFNIIFNLLPPTPDRARRRQLPIPKTP